MQPTYTRNIGFSHDISAVYQVTFLTQIVEKVGLTSNDLSADNDWLHTDEIRPSHDEYHHANAPQPDTQHYWRSIQKTEMAQ